MSSMHENLLHFPIAEIDVSVEELDYYADLLAPGYSLSAERSVSIDRRVLAFVEHASAGWAEHGDAQLAVAEDAADARLGARTSTSRRLDRRRRQSRATQLLQACAVMLLVFVGGPVLAGLGQQLSGSVEDASHASGLLAMPELLPDELVDGDQLRERWWSALVDDPLDQVPRSVALPWPSIAPAPEPGEHAGARALRCEAIDALGRELERASQRDHAGSARVFKFIIDCPNLPLEGPLKQEAYRQLFSSASLGEIQRYARRCVREAVSVTDAYLKAIRIVCGGHDSCGELRELRKAAP